MKEQENREIKESQNKVNRRDALKKFGKYAAVTALGTFILLNPQQAQASSPGAPGGGF